MKNQRTKIDIRKSSLSLFLIVLAFHFLSAQAFPYEIKLEPFTISGLNGVHSFAAAEYAGKWLIISGRKDGMHRGGGGMNNPPFPASSNNTTIYVVDPIAEQVWSTDINTLPLSIRNQMSSTNTSFYQDGDDLYIVGGYGEDNTGNYVTYGYITAIDVPGIIANITNGTSIVNDFIQLADSNMAIAGGQLGKIGNTYYLVGGMELQGQYTMMVNPDYSSEIRNFEILNDGSSLTINNYTATSDPEFHRRDYNLVPQIFPDSTFGYMVSSGVFTPSDGVYYNPIEIKSGAYTVIPVGTFKQEFSHYQSAKLAMYDPNINEMHSIFFGGIAQYYYDANGNKIDDPDIPFVKTISRISRDANGTYSESVFSTTMPEYLGSGSELFLNDTLPTIAHGIIDMSQLTGDTILVGYIFGGLLSNAADIFPMNTSNSYASNTIYKVKLYQTVLPVELISFTGTFVGNSNCENGKITLNWKTASEVNLKSFEIERGKFGNFEKIGYTQAIGESNVIQNYTFEDNNPLTGSLYYRLKMIDQDGTFRYSNVIGVMGCKNKSLELSPNPTKSKLFIRGEFNPLKLKCFSQEGIECRPSISPINGGFSLDLKGYPSGVYFLNYNNETYKIIKN